MGSIHRDVRRSGPSRSSTRADGSLGTRFARRFRRALNRIVPHDVSTILLLDTRHLPPVPPARETAPSGPPVSPGPVAMPALAVLDAATLRARAAAGVPGFAGALPSHGHDETLWCAVAVHAGVLVGYVWFARGHVPAALNHGGSRFAGIGLRLPSATAYAFRVRVAPAWRGHGLGAALLEHGIRQAPHGTPGSVVTTTDRHNVAFLGSVRAAGFRRRDWAAEFVIGRRHRYRLPRPLAVPGGQRVVFFAG